jgi:DNA-binding NtrC family response regulator
MHRVRTADRHNAVAPAAEDEDVAGRSSARLLITASTPRGVETIARRIHGVGPRAPFPFAHTWAGDFPVAPQALREYCGGALHAAAGGSMLISAVEELPPAIQDALIDVLAGLECARRQSAAVRLISGTTVSLLDRVAAGTFSEQLFYRLNSIHLNGCEAAEDCANLVDQRYRLQDDQQSNHSGGKLLLCRIEHSAAPDPR